MDEGGGKASLDIIITHYLAGEELILDSASVTPLGEPITITNLKYYLSNFQLINAGGKTVTLPVEYFLVNEKNNASKTISLKLPGGNYRAIRMLIGVDSARNVSGVQEAALDPALGMFWSWNTGYIFAKLEGKSPVSTAPLQGVTYHIGGFRAAESALQTIELPFPRTTILKPGEPAIAGIVVNLDRWFDGSYKLYIAREPFCMNPGELAQHISVNYSKMFAITSLSN